MTWQIWCNFSDSFIAENKKICILLSFCSNNCGLLRFITSSDVMMISVRTWRQGNWNSETWSPIWAQPGVNGLLYKICWNLDSCCDTITINICHCITRNPMDGAHSAEKIYLWQTNIASIIFILSIKFWSKRAKPRSFESHDIRSTAMLMVDLSFWRMLRHK